MAACAGIVAGITSLQFPGTFIGYWIAGGCLIAATSVLATKLGVWLIWNTNIRKILLWIPGAVSVAAALLYVLQAAGERQPQPDEPAAITQGASRSGTTETATIVEVRVPRVPIPETQPGFTRIVLMQIARRSRGASTLSMTSHPTAPEWLCFWNQTRYRLAAGRART